MIDEELCVHAKEFVEQAFTLHGIERHIAHGVHAVAGEFFCDTFAYAPEFGDRRIVPKLFPVAPFIQFGNAHAILVGRRLFRHDVHGYLAEVKVCADAGCRRYPCMFQYIPNHRHGQLVRRHPVGVQVGRHVHEYLVNGVHVNILRGDVFQVNLIDARAVLDVFCHAGWRRDVIHLPIFVRLEFLVLP